MDFKDQLKSSVDLVNVVGEYVRLKKSGAQRYMGLCPFHNEKTPSFTVHAARQFYKCFSCGEGGDVFTFVQKIEGVSFYEALKLLAERHGVPMPKRSLVADEDSKLREAVFRMHEQALESFRANLRGPSGEEARAYLARRGVAEGTVERFELGYSERSGRAFPRLFEQRGFTPAQMEQSGLVRRRDDGTFYDYFRNRLMFPIHNESGKVVGFGGRALAADDNPKYLNSPETPIYVKSQVLYNLHRAKEAVRKEDRAILVEGYMDAIGVSAAGFGGVVASCGTSLTEQQVKTLKRHSGRIVVNFDPDAAGANATERSLDMLLQYDFDVRILELPGGLDPDEFCLKRGAAEYGALLSDAKKYFFWLAQRGIATTADGGLESRIALMKTLVSKLQLMSDPWEQVAIAHELAGYLGIGDDLAREFRKAIVARRRPDPKPVPRRGGYNERVLLKALLDETSRRDEVVEALEGCAGVARLPTAAIFQAVFAIHRAGSPITFDGLNARLEEADRQRLAEIALTEDGEVEISREHVMDCVKQLVQSEEVDRRSQLKARVKDAERAGNFADALRLARELQEFEQAGEARR